MIRLFIALPLPGPVEEELDRLIASLKPLTRAVRWVPAQNIHLTARFLGDTDEKLVPKIIKSIDTVASEHAAFDTVLDRVGGFPQLKRPRVIWVGGPEPLEPAAGIARQLELRMRELRFAPEKRGFKAHLTLGRVREGQPLGPLAERLETLTFGPLPLHLDRVVLFKSTLTPQGSIYERLHEAPLVDERFSG